MLFLFTKYRSLTLLSFESFHIGLVREMFTPRQSTVNEATRGIRRSLPIDALRPAVQPPLVLRAVSNEVDNLCSKRDPSLLRKKEKDDLINYDMLKLCEEWKRRPQYFMHSF